MGILYIPNLSFPESLYLGTGSMIHHIHHRYVKSKARGDGWERCAES